MLPVVLCSSAKDTRMGGGNARVNASPKRGV